MAKPNPFSPRRWMAMLTLVIAAAGLGGCGDTPWGGKTLKVIAGSEVKDIEFLLPQLEKETGIRLEFTHIGTLDGAEMILSGRSDHDLGWFSHAKYLTLAQTDRKRIHAQEKIMLSPVVLAVWRGKAKEWGWLDNPNVSWSDIAAKASAGELRYAMTDPTASNTGFSAVIGVNAALGGGDAIAEGDIDMEKSKGFFKAQKMTAGSSGWLADSFVREQNSLDGIINYESVLMKLNADKRLKEPLHIVYPKDGIITADYPLLLLDPEQREAFDQVVAFFKTPEVQKKIMQQTRRRPVVAKVRPDAGFPNQLLIELPFPSTIDTVNRMLFSWLDESRSPSHSFFVLDVSGSMSGQRLNDLKQAVINLTGLDQSVTGRFARFRAREKVTIITFSNVVRGTNHFEIDDKGEASADMTRIRQTINNLKADGGTAVYTALKHAYFLAAEARANEPDRFYSVVLMSDGMSNNGITLQEFIAEYRRLGDIAEGIRTFPILFGESEDSLMRQLAEATGGRLFNARDHSLAAVFKKIRGYQ